MNAVSDVPVLVRLPNLGEPAADVPTAGKTESLRRDESPSPQDAVFLGDEASTPGPTKTSGGGESWRKSGALAPPRAMSLGAREIQWRFGSRVSLPVVYKLVAFSLIASVVAYAVVVAGRDAPNRVAEEEMAAEGGKPSMARGRLATVPDDPLADIGVTSSVPKTRKAPASPVSQYGKPMGRDAASPPPQPFQGGSSPASRLDTALLPPQADEPAVVAKYETPNLLRRDGWNEYVIRCRERQVQLSINGHRAIDYTAPDESASPLTVIGLQIQVGPTSEAGNTDIELIGEVAPCELSVPSGQGAHSLAGTDRPFPSPSPSFGGKQNDEQDAVCVKWKHAERSAVDDVDTSSIRFVENPTPRLTLPRRTWDDSTAPAQRR